MGDSAARDLAKTRELVRDSTKRQARYDREKLKKLKIKSPDTGKMHRVSYGNSHYFFKTKKKMYTFIEGDKHYEILGMKMHKEDRVKPIIEEKFSHTNQIPENDES